MCVCVCVCVCVTLDLIIPRIIIESDLNLLPKYTLFRKYIFIKSAQYIHSSIFFSYFHHTTSESTCDTLSSSAANQGDNTVSLVQGGTATPGDIYIYIYIYIYIFSASCHAISTDISDPLSPPHPIVHRFQQVLRATPRIYTELLYVSSSWSSCLCSAMWRGQLEYSTYELVSISPAVSCMSTSSNFDNFCDGW